MLVFFKFTILQVDDVTVNQRQIKNFIRFLKI